jgi:hypothetical protein
VHRSTQQASKVQAQSLPTGVFIYTSGATGIGRWTLQSDPGGSEHRMLGISRTPLGIFLQAASADDLR